MHYYIFVPSIGNVKLTNGNMGHTQVIGIILCFFPKYPIIYPVGPVYYCTGKPSNKISLGDTKCYVGLQKVMSEPLENCGFVDLKGHYWRSLHRTQKKLYHLQIDVVKLKP